MRVRTNKGDVTDEVRGELDRLGYVVGGDALYTIDDKEDGDGRDLLFTLVGIQETATANGVKIWLLMSGGDLKDGASYSVPIGRVDRAQAQAVA